MNEAVETLLSISQQSNNEDSKAKKRNSHLVTDNLGTPPQSEDEFDPNSHDDNSLLSDINEHNVKNNNSELARVCIFSFFQSIDIFLEKLLTKVNRLLISFY